ncbi:hypothetical protein BpHYR1_001613 [Brachionus plicatilis]|uniref:Uncharacterized protein n=1 Tax=Brachionus plicatilis TaxID=10195 RepID=A0A3M7Q9I2_BRAPC|nr:hypothetical protein BpHYR1_001613 [Brachionus plicatilis]
MSADDMKISHSDKDLKTVLKNSIKKLKTKVIGEFITKLTVTGMKNFLNETGKFNNNKIK